MGYADYYWGLYRDYYRDPFPHSLLRTRQSLKARANKLPGVLQALLWGPWSGAEE